MLDEIIFGGQVLETSSSEVMKAVEEISKYTTALCVRVCVLFARLWVYLDIFLISLWNSLGCCGCIYFPYILDSLFLVLTVFKTRLQVRDSFEFYIIPCPKICFWLAESVANVHR